jgi:hypothetical protein
MSESTILQKPAAIMPHRRSEPGRLPPKTYSCQYKNRPNKTAAQEHGLKRYSHKFICRKRSALLGQQFARVLAGGRGDFEAAQHAGDFLDPALGVERIDP